MDDPSHIYTDNLLAKEGTRVKDELATKRRNKREEADDDDKDGENKKLQE